MKKGFDLGEKGPVYVILFSEYKIISTERSTIY